MECVENSYFLYGSTVEWQTELVLLNMSSHGFQLLKLRLYPEKETCTVHCENIEDQIRGNVVCSPQTSVSNIGSLITEEA